LIHKLLLFFGLFLQAHCMNASSIDSLREKIKWEQANFPAGDVRNKEYVKTILCTMYQTDQEVRQVLIQDRKNLELQKIMSEIDQFYTGKMKEILAVHGWITISQFGVDADNQAWLLVQHADHDHAFQEQVLMKLTDLYESGDTNKRNYAYLYDRVALQSEKLGRKQKYGTQCVLADNGDLFLSPYVGSLQDINMNRQQVGLGPVEEYIERLKDMYKK